MTGLWWTCPAQCRVSSAWHQLLDDHESRRYQRYLPLDKRHEFLVARAMVRTVLGQALGAPAASLHFQANEWGRPELSPPGVLRFSLTHTEGLVALLLSDEFEVGLDAEPLARGPTVLALHSGVYAPQELAEMAALTPAQQGERAITLWTLKESYAKALGMGFALAFDALFFRLPASANTPVLLQEKTPPPHSSADWQFQTFHHGPHVISASLAPLQRARGPGDASRSSLAPESMRPIQWKPADFGL